MLQPLGVAAVLACYFFITLSTGSATCPPPSSSPVCKNPNEEYDHCPAPCPPRKCGVNKAVILCAVPPQPGDPECEPGCRCSDGHLKNSTGICIPEDQCPKCNQPNEVYDECNAPCPPRRCDVDERLIRCAAPPKPGDPECEPGCRCADGYYRNRDGICVTRDQCEKGTCGENEVYSSCIDTCSAQNCSQLGFPISCTPSDICTRGCICKDGYRRDDNGNCIPAAECPSCGGDENAESGCGNCRTRCQDLDNTEPKICTDICYPNGCNCKKGYVLNTSTGKCVHPEDCPCRKDPNSEPGCGLNCNKHCSNVGKPPGKCPRIACPPNGCECKDGYYYRNDTKSCVRPEDCVKCNGAYEYYELNPLTCPPQTCESIGKKYHCPAILEGSANKPACRCIKGYYRNKNGDCISEKNCLKCRGEHEYYACGGACDNVCATLQEQNQTNCPIRNIKCNEMCYCESGYARNKDKVCIPIDQCPRPCGKNEVYSTCIDTCSAQNCSQLGFPISCTPSDICTRGCICKDGYRRDDNGDCIPAAECPSCGGDENAESGCGNCRTRCQDLDNTEAIFCTQICYPNSCNCKKGYVLNTDTGKCVHPEDCPCRKDPNSEPGCGLNCNKHCSNVGKPPGICPRIACPPNGCECKDGYYFSNITQSCVRPEDCVKCNGPYEYYELNPLTCPPQTCESIGKKYHCPAILEGSANKPACRCIKGYYRNKNGDCISEKNCLKCRGEHEYYACGGACDNVCATLQEQNQTNCPIRNIKCNEMCYCESGYARNKDKVCIPIDQCPRPCGKNEVYSTCIDTCSAQNCSQLGFPISCTPSDICTRGCICKDGYRRDDNGNCIPAAECPSCGGDENAESGCGNCRTRCQDLDNTEPKICTDICYPNGCNCKKGYVLNTSTGKCVHPDACPCRKDPNSEPGCGLNCNKHCSNVGKPPGICPRIACPPNGCECKDGYYFSNITKSCVSPDECDKCYGENEYFEPCPSNCPPFQTCDIIGKSYSCPARPVDPEHCEPACRCIEGYYRNLIGECISEENCLKCPGDHEYYSCGVACDNVCANIHEQNQTNCLIINVKCNEMCYCESGYARDKNNTCIPINECPSTERSKRSSVRTERSKRSSVPCEPTPTPKTTVNKTEALENFNRGIIALSGEFVYQLLTSNSNSNFALSPTSLLIALAAIVNFATGLNLEQLLKVLYFDSKDENTSVFPGFLDDYENQTDILLSIATKCYANSNYPLSDYFKQFASDFFNVDGENIDFSQNVQVANTINKWVEQQTNNKIQNLVSPDMLSADTRIVLINAIYFLGNWMRQFNPNNTETKDFYLDDTNTIQLPIMYQENSFSYGEDTNYQALGLLYKNSNYSFLVILPKQKGRDALNSLGNDLRNPDVFTGIIDRMSRQDVKVSLPRLHVTSIMDVGEMLKKYNVTEMFNSGSNGFEGILNRSEPVYVSDVVQKCVINVTETGTEAAAATAAVITTLSLPLAPPPTFVFNANHPYLFYILFKKSILFSGAFLQ